MTKTSSIREQKNFTLEIKDFDDALGLVKGYLATFSNVDEQGDRIRPGAFKRTLQNKYQYKQVHNKTFLFPLLWQHDTGTPIGGYTEAKEDNIGLYVEFQLDMDTQRGREAYSGLKKGYIYQQSIGYDTIQSEYVKEPDGKMVRDLIELRLWEGSVVTFPANELAVVTSVKANTMQTKDIVGNTSGPIGPRDEAWDSSKAEGQIWDAAYDDEKGEVKASVAKKYFMVQEGDGTKKGDYSYPFWYAGDDPHICVGAVIAIAGAIQGSRGASAPDGLKPKVETLYKRISDKYSDDPELVPPWKDDEKSMQPKQKKTLLEHFNEEVSEDLLCDWMDVYVCSLTGAVFDAFTIGDQPAQDISEALDAFKEIVLSKFVAQAIECDLSQYLADNDFSFNPAESTIHNGSDDGYYSYMSRGTPAQRKTRRKAMYAADATTGGYTADHVKSLKDAATKSMKKIADHADQLHEAANGVKAMLDSAKSRFAKEGRSFSNANTQALQDHADGLHDAANGVSKAINLQMKMVNTVADDMANVMQGAEPTYADPNAGTPDDGQQEGKSKPLAKTSLLGDNDIEKALSSLKGLRSVR